jgi:hypothetical protein
MGNANDFSAEIDTALFGDAPIPREKVLCWIQATSDLSNLASSIGLPAKVIIGFSRISAETHPCALIQRYLLQCIREGVSDDDEIQGRRYEAVQSLHVWFCHLLEKKDTSAVLTAAAGAVTELFLASGEDGRTAIETGFLEHVLETAALRPYFEHWSRDPNLREAWDRALEWGKAHPDYTWGMLQQLRRIENK